MLPLLGWCLLLAGAGVARADPDFYSAWCPCQPQYQCPNYYGRFFDDILIFGQVPPCKQFDFVRCCSSNNIPEGFNLERQVQYLPERVQPAPEAAPPAVVDGPRRHGRVRGAASAPAGAVARGLDLDLDVVSRRQDVLDFKAQQEKLKRDIANGIDNPNPPCGCYTAGTCPGRYATKSTGRDIGCLAGYETCCFLDDPWPNYQVTNLTINVPCSTALACARFYGLSPFDISAFGALEPCYLGQNRCLDFIVDGSSPQPSIVRPQVQPTTRPTTRRPTTRRPTTRRTTPRPTTTRRPAPTRRPVTTYRPATRPTPPPTPFTFRTTARPQPEPQPSGGSSNIIDVVTNGAYLPPSRDFGSAADRAEPAGLAFALPL